MKSRHAEAHEALIAEIAGEQAATLGRIAGVLEADLAALAELERAIASASRDERPALVAEHGARRAHAKLYHWYLVIQREALGMRDHSALAALYRIPPRVV